MTQVTTPTTGLKPRNPVAVNASLYNGGDDTAPSSRAELVLVSADGKRTSLGHTSAAGMKAGDSIAANLVRKIPAKLSKGAYTVEVRAKLQDGVKQHSEDNDVLTAGTMSVK
jgi:CARDB